MRKMKKYSITLERGIVSILLCILCVYCQSIEVLEPPIAHDLLNHLQQEFDSKAFKTQFKLEHTIHWADGQKGFDNDLNVAYFEFPITYSSVYPTKNQDSTVKKVDYRSHYSIWVYQSDNGKYDFFLKKIMEEIPNSVRTKTSKLERSVVATNFSGSIHLYTMKSKLVFAKRIKDGTPDQNIYIGDRFNNTNHQNRMIQDCQIVATYHYIDFYTTFSVNGEEYYRVYTGSRLTGVTYEEYCDSYHLPNLDTGGGNSTGSYINSGDGGEYSDCPGGKCKYDIVEEEENCDPGYEMDAFGECVERNPCAEVQTQLDNPNFNAKLEELKRKTHLHEETGYKQNNSGVFTALTPINGGDHLDFQIDNTTTGYLHTHLDDYETGKIVEGLPEIKQITRMFSPNDVISFLSIVKRSAASNIPLSSVYGSMVSSTGTYTLRFLGKRSDIPNNLNAEELKYIYKSLLEENGRERGFLKFLNEVIQIQGIKLFKIKDSGRIRPKTLNANDRVETGDC